MAFDDIRKNHARSVDYTPAIETTATNKKAYGDLIINKTDKDTGEIMKDITFKLSGTSDLKENISLTKTTDINGQVKFEHVPAGSYTLHETIPAGYQTIADKTVVIAKDATNKVVTLDIKNEKIKHNLILKKKVTGNLADINKEFDYKITVYDGDTPITGKLSIEKNGTVTEIDNGSTIKLKHNQTVTYTNNKEKSTITGIFIKQKPFILLILLSIIAFIGMFYTSKKLTFN